MRYPIFDCHLRCGTKYFDTNPIKNNTKIKPIQNYTQITTENTQSEQYCAHLFQLLTQATHKINYYNDQLYKQHLPSYKL